MPFYDDAMADNQAKASPRAALGGKEGHGKDMRLRLRRMPLRICNQREELAVATRADIDATVPPTA
jgi:hypothetical protein